jgi:hypothetical protein
VASPFRGRAPALLSVVVGNHAYGSCGNPAASKTRTRIRKSGLEHGAGILVVNWPEKSAPTCVFRCARCLPQVREHRPCAANRTAYGTTVIGKAFVLFPSFDSTITFG